MSPKTAQSNIVLRPPVVVVMGHIDHGKSRLLDYIRKTNIIEHEAGGITQQVAAYEVIHKDEKGLDRKITFLDTPGHEAFSRIRERGAEIADIAILVVSAEDSVKDQTIEALKVIKKSNLPYVVAINKIDKPAANVEKTKMDLIEKEVYLEGYGGDVPYVPISAKEGTGVSDLLNLILLVADLKEFKANPENGAQGYVLESNLDPKRGIASSLIIKDGTLKKGMFVAAGDAFAPTRIFEDFLGKTIRSATFSSPVRIVGWNKVPEVGALFETVESKKEAENIICQNIESEKNIKSTPPLPSGGVSAETKLIPLVIKADRSGSIEAIKKGLAKLNTEEIAFKVVKTGIGAINESDIQAVSADRPARRVPGSGNPLVVGFNVKYDTAAFEKSERLGTLLKTFNVIYELQDFLKAEAEKGRPRKEVKEITGQAKIIRSFSREKNKQVIGGKVISGKIIEKGSVQIMRRDFEVGQGIALELQQNKARVKEVEEGKEFGMMIESKIEIAPGDVLESFVIVCR
ncbi:translation initiation factor IF-2 [Candidatus Nomurabacteria bacterium RIFCSPHIGHO2_01_FULL_42_16]|uniref:Translation initiation factor IF-2 n=1 Tax=Candidatus Nomurabacteria bacterium RIFCSPHIGHO2_01_FULL_42_16 TaxID=1801743 RepID=A0A1F6VKA5_9BACT|nr:MAG: translation initiation factor IF-2 [Candidatus Nomurabacteria bacterium RIFCSPHIGHO2_01_FULL_42_16]